MDWSALDQKPSFKKLRLFSSSKLDSGSYIEFVTRAASG